MAESRVVVSVARLQELRDAEAEVTRLRTALTEVTEGLSELRVVTGDGVKAARLLLRAREALGGAHDAASLGILPAALLDRGQSRG